MPWRASSSASAVLSLRAAIRSTRSASGWAAMGVMGIKGHIEEHARSPAVTSEATHADPLACDVGHDLPGAPHAPDRNAPLLLAAAPLAAHQRVVVFTHEIGRAHV